MATAMKPICFDAEAGGTKLAVRSHVSDGALIGQVTHDCMTKAVRTIEKFEAIVRRVRENHDEINESCTLKPLTLAMIDGKEPILYLAVSGADKGAEIHVNLTNGMDYHGSEFLIP